jgi:hypothetical protein
MEKWVLKVNKWEYDHSRLARDHPGKTWGIGVYIKRVNPRNTAARKLIEQMMENKGCYE